MRYAVYNTFPLSHTADVHPRLTISSSRFLNNSNSGVAVNDLIGQTMIFNTVFMGNGFGVHINKINGGLSSLSTTFLYNRKHGIYIGNVTGSITFWSLNSSRNHGSGIAIEKGSVSFQMSFCEASKNQDHGLEIYNQINSNINISSLEVYESGRKGLYFRDFSEDSCILISNLTSVRNRGDGAFFEKLSIKQFSVSTSSFNENYDHGLLAEKVVSANVAFWRASTSKNYNNGLFFQNGKGNINLQSWSSVGNNDNGLYLNVQEGKLQLNNCFIDGNKRNGIKLMDGQYAKLQSFGFYDSVVSENENYGILIYVYMYNYYQTKNYSLIFMNSTIANNSNGGILIYPYCSYGYKRFIRHVQLSFIENKVNGNQNDGLNVRSPEVYGLEALLRGNTFENNTGSSLKVTHNCRYGNMPVHVHVLSNTFRKNKGDHVIFVDYGRLPDRRFSIVRNNTFNDNEAPETFSTRYIRIKTQAVVTLKEGNFTVERNFFDNPSYPHDIATYLQERNRIISAKQNWWGTQDECKIKKRIFDLEDRIDLARIEYYPFLVSSDFTNLSFHIGVRPFCFLIGNQLGGILDQSLTLSKRNTSFEVISDVTVLSNRSLTIEGNVTLEFPLQAVFFVQGQVVIKGTDHERVQFIPQMPTQREIRLVDGVGPWDGRLEILLNDTWMSVCGSPHVRNYLPAVACKQLGYESMSSSYRYKNGREETFLRNVICDTNKVSNITGCRRERWASHATCSPYVLYVHCNTPYWAGVHLGFAAKKSVVQNLDISYAGFSYRNDLGVPGIAFRVDFTHHEIVGVLINNSAHVGLQVIYSHAFKPDDFDIEKLTIMNSFSDGIRVQSPFLKISKTDVLNARSTGFLVQEPSWGVISKQVLELGDPEVTKYINLCSENATILNKNNLHYYLVVLAELTRNCESIIQVPKEYQIGLQLIKNGVYSTFNVYSERNMSSSNPWEIRRSRICRSWVSNSSAIRLQSLPYYRNYITEVHFLLSLVKGKSLIKEKVGLQY